MSNTRKLRTLNPGSGALCRPKYTWRGYRPPRSARKQWEDLQSFLRRQKAAKLVTLPEQKEAPCEEPVCQAVESLGLAVTPWQHDLMHKFTQEEKTNA